MVVLLPLCPRREVWLQQADGTAMGDGPGQIVRLGCGHRSPYPRWLPQSH